MSSASSLAGKRILVTGAGRGIGQAMALLCHAEGARVAICARSAAELQATADLAAAQQTADNHKHHDLLMYTVDVTQPAAVQTMVKAMVAEWDGGLDMLINNAGRGQARRGTVAELTAADFMDLLQVNVVAVHTVSAACVPYLRASGDGAQIINLSSKAGKVGLPHMSHYVASKFALEGLTAAWAAELAADGVRVNSISPGMVDTVSFPKEPGRPGVRTAAAVREGLMLLMTGTDKTGHYLHVDELDLVRAKGLPDETALKPINEPTFADTL